LHYAQTAKLQTVFEGELRIVNNEIDLVEGRPVKTGRRLDEWPRVGLHRIEVGERTVLVGEV